MATSKTKTQRTRIALQLPADLDRFFKEEAQAKLTTKSALIRGVLLGYRQRLEQGD